jgi:N-acetylglucosamine kinase-like BadF-type ATPase
MSNIVGIDQGGTKTVVAVANEYGSILGVGYAEGACHSIQGMDIAMEYVRNATKKALDSANCSLEWFMPG